jgi:O-antigen/teichoic acid export membrane protein
MRKAVSAVGVVSSTPGSLWYSGLHSLATSVALLVIGLVTSIVIARSLGPAGKGSFDLILATVEIVTMVFGLSLGSGVVYIVARRQAALGVLYLRLALISIVQMLLPFGLLLLTRDAAVAAALLPSDVGALEFAALGILLLFGFLNGYMRAILNGRQQIPVVNIADLIGRGMMLALIGASAGVLWFGGGSLTSTMLLWIQATVVVVLFVIMFGWLRQAFRESMEGTSGLREIVLYAVPAYFANLVQYLNYRLDIFFISFYVGLRGVGLYTLAVGLAQLTWLISSIASQVLLPNVAGSVDVLAAQERTARASRLALWISIALAIGMGGVAVPLLPLVYGEAFRESVAALLWLLPGVAFFSVANVIGSYIAGIGKPHLNLIVAVIGLLITIGLVAWLIPKLGIVGAAIASTASYIVTTIAIIAMFIRETGRSVWEVLLLNRDDLVLLKGLIGRLLQSRDAT